MDEFHQEEGLQINSLPPRSTIHGGKEDHGDSEKKSSLYMLLGSFVFIIIAAVLYYQFAVPSEETVVTDDKPIENAQPQDNEQLEPIDKAEDAENNLDKQETTDQDPAPIEEKSEDMIYVVQTGENLYRISLKHYGSGEYFEALAKYNGLSDANDIYAGMELKIPEKKYLFTDK